jgi:DNA-binding NtrC family response regulator
LSLVKLVAIVDDEQDITTLFHDALRSINGITIFAFTDPILALEHFQKNKDAYALVISDFTMPRLNGMDLLRKMKELKKYVRTVLMTAFEMEDTLFRDYTKNEIINGFFQKPVRLTNLIEEVHTQLQFLRNAKSLSFLNIGII